jgi:hypothetical protein
MSQLLNECLKLCWVHTETVFDMFQLKRFSSKQFRYVLSAANHESKDEYYYLFLKRLCQVLIELGKQLCALWVSNKIIKT